MRTLVALALVLLAAAPLAGEAPDPAVQEALAATLRVLRDPALRSPAVAGSPRAAAIDTGLAEEAVAEYREAVRLKPDYTAAYRGLGRALERAGRLDEARAAYGRGLEVARQTGDLQTGKEIEVFLRRLGPRP